MPEAIQNATGEIHKLILETSDAVNKKETNRNVNTLILLLACSELYEYERSTAKPEIMINCSLIIITVGVLIFNIHYPS